jgi:hypothetical protein
MERRSRVIEESWMRVQLRVGVTVDGGTLSQGGKPVPWDSHGFYEIALDADSLTVSP